MNKNFLISVLLLFPALFSAVQAQNNPDSLIKALQVQVEDTNKIKLLFEIEKSYINLNKPDSALIYLDKNEKLINELNATQFEYDFNYEKIAVYHALADYKKALQYTFKSIEVADRNKNVYQKADSYRALFNIYYNLGEVENAIKYALYSIHFSDSIHYTENQVINYGNLTRLYNDLEQFKKAVEYGLKGIEEGRKENNIKGLLICINNTALAYRNLNDDNLAENLFKEQLEIATRENFPRSASKAMINLCMLYAQTTQTEQLKKYTSLLNIFVENNPDTRLSPTDKVFQYIINGYNYLFQRNFIATETELDKGIHLATENEIIFHLSDLYLLKTKLKYAENKYVEAENYNRKYDSIQQILTSEVFSEYSLDLEKKYETGKKEQTITLQAEQLKNRRFLIAILLISLVGILITVFVFYRNYQQKQIIQQHRIHQLETEKYLAATESVIKGEEQERSRLAKELHDGLGGMLSGIKYAFSNLKNNLIMTPDNAMSYERAIDMLDTSIREMRRVAYNMMPEALLKFGLDAALRDFCSEINFAGSIKITYQSFGLKENIIGQSKSIAVYRIVQELINNALKHSGASEMLVQLSFDNQKMSITVEDNGKGFDVQHLEKANGIGWRNIRNRVDFIKGTLDIHSSENHGTSVLIEFDV